MLKIKFWIGCKKKLQTYTGFPLYALLKRLIQFIKLLAKFFWSLVGCRNLSGNYPVVSIRDPHRLVDGAQDRSQHTTDEHRDPDAAPQY